MECSICHPPQGKQVQPEIYKSDKLFQIETFPSVKSSEGTNNYSAILSAGQTPYQLGPFYRGGVTGWSWWDTGVFGAEKQKNLIALMVFNRTTGTIKPETGLAEKLMPTWPRASYRNYSRNFSYKADTATSPITAQTNYPNNADIWMIKEVDLAGYSGANLTFWTWYSMEKDWDYGYVAVSVDGEVWTNLPGSITTSSNPNGNNLGNGITGNSSSAWIEETMNLTPYAGNKIFLGFRFKSDPGVNGEGWYVDSINVSSGVTTIFYDDADNIKTLSVNVTYPHLNISNITDPITSGMILQYSQHTQQVNVLEDMDHPGTYIGYFKYDPFGEQYSGNYSVTFDTIINGSQVTATAQFQTTVFGCQSCHNKKDGGNETSFIHNESGYYGGQESCMFLCHSGSRGFYGGSPPFMGPPLSLNPMHVHEMQYGHNGGFLPNLYYQQPPYNITSHASTTTCSQCHTSFIHDNVGTDTVNIANYTLYGTNISFSSGTHQNLTCENCHGSLAYPEIPQYQYQLQGSLGNYSPAFTSHKSFTDTYIISVNQTENLTITVNGDNTTKSVELYSVGPVDNTSTALQGPCGGYPCDITQSLESPIIMNITNPYTGTWIVNLVQLQEGIVNYTITSNYPIQKKPIIEIPECSTCHNANGDGKAFTTDQIPDWNPGFAHVDTNNDGTLDIQCRMCHDAMHDIKIKNCQTCHATAPENHPITEPAFSEYTRSRCLGCHGSAHNVSAGGGADCVSCHDIGGGFAPLDKRINVSSIKQGVHKFLNNGTDNATLLTDTIDKACWACHGDGMEPSNGHPGNFRNPYSCENCHGQTGNLSYTNASLISSLTSRKVFNHVPSPGISQYASSIRNNSSADCKGCHDKSKVIYSDSGLSMEANVSHYASRTNLVSPTINCGLCHKDPANASAYWANLTRHPARTQDIEFCKNCHFTEDLSTDFHSSAPIKIKRVHVDFDWQGGLCSTPCHGTPRKVCEDCHLENGSGPYLQQGANGTWLNDSIPRVFAHTNFSTQINVPNQSNVIAPSQGAKTFSSCYSFNITTLSGTCHAVPIQNKEAGGGYFTLNNYTPAYDKGSAYHEAQTIDRMPDTKNCVFCHDQTDQTIRFIWGNSTQITGGTHDWYTGNDNSRCWGCHDITGTAPKDFHSESMRGGGGGACMGCHPSVTSSDLGRHSNMNGTSDVDNGDCTTCHYRDFPMVKGAVNNSNTYFCADCHTTAGNGSNKSTIRFTDKLHGENTCMDCHFADGKYHQDNPRGSVANSTYIARYTTSNTNATDCADCHYAANLDDAPFNAPGGGTHIPSFGSACTSGCHAGPSIMIQRVHNIGPMNSSLKPTISVPTLSASSVNQGTDVIVTATVNFTTSYAFVDGAQYRIMSGSTEIRSWTPMLSLDGNFNGSSEVATATITNISAGIYTIQVRGMAGGPALNTSIRYYPMNGDVSAINSTNLTVLAPMGYINGTVTRGGQPVAGAMVSTTDASSTTDAGGNYSLALQAGNYSMTAIKRPEYYDSITMHVAVIPNNTTIQDFMLTLKPTGNIAGIVRKAIGLPE